VPVVHSVLPAALTAEVDSVLAPAGIAHVPHEGSDPVASAEVAAGDPAALVLLGPFRSADVREAVAATAPAGLPLIAPLATWTGVTRHDEPGCDDAADHRGTVFRLLARDTEVATRLAADLRGSGRRAHVVAGHHEYGLQLDGQLALAGLPRSESAEAADLVVLCGLAGEPEIERARLLAPLPVVAFDGVQGADLGAEREIRLALPFAPTSGRHPEEIFAGVEQARRAAELILEARAAGARERSTFLAALRSTNRFDEHGDPIAPEVWLWRAGHAWALEADRPLRPPAA
jgi:hypothetical protein